MDDLDVLIDDFIWTAKSAGTVCPLAFWKSFQYKFPVLADLAKKYLGIQAASVGPERMFSISGHIFSSKRRKMGAGLFSDCVILKLNENLLNLC